PHFDAAHLEFSLALRALLRSSLSLACDLKRSYFTSLYLGIVLNLRLPCLPDSSIFEIYLLSKI
ncbi:hypothetical protein, partial [uncultured Campylobacter sp.]|uniref:hypothetical protein n=1 Tax=uncultured Campylobacter sp. TaxID=218934 RepID=UPI00260DA0FD